MGRGIVLTTTALPPPFYLSSRVQTGDSLSAQEVDDEQNKRVEDPIQDNEEFYDAYCAQTKPVMERRLEDFLSSHKFDSHYDRNSFFTEAVKRKDTIFLQRLVSHSRDSEACAAGLLEALQVAALKKDKDMLPVVANLAKKTDINLTGIKDYDVYHRNSEIQSLIDELLALPNELVKACSVSPDRFV